MSKRKLCELPGWDEAVAAVQERLHHNIGNELKVCGAFIPPPSFTCVAPTFLHAMVVGLFRQNSQKEYRIAVKELEACEVIQLADIQTRRHHRAMYNRRLNAHGGIGSWSPAWWTKIEGDPSPESAGPL